MRKGDLHAGIKRLASADVKFAAALEAVGMPAERHREDGFAALLRIIIGQQVSVAAANAIEAKLRGRYPDLLPQDFMVAEAEDLRSLGLSYQKVGYAKGLSEAVLAGDLPLSELPALSDAEVISHITSLKGFGRWSAENYCLFSLGREDIFPADDLGLQAGLQIYRGNRVRPTAGQVERYVKRWRPYRSSAAIFIWHYYGVMREVLREEKNLKKEKRKRPAVKRAP